MKTNFVYTSKAINQISNVNQMKQLPTILILSTSLIVASSSYAQVLRSGDGLLPGVIDPNVRFFIGPTMTGQFTPTGPNQSSLSVPFASSASWPNARVVQRYDTSWVAPNAGSLAGAQWLSTANQASNGWTAMYAHRFLYPHTGPADLSVNIATDDQLWGVYLNGTLYPVPTSPFITFGTAQTLSFSGLPMIPFGFNTLYFYTRNIGFQASGIIYSGQFKTKEKPFQGNEEFVSGCCEGRNYVRNSTFKSGRAGFTSDLTYKSAPPLNQGQYGIFNGNSAWPLSNPSMVIDEVTNSASVGNFLVARVSKTQQVIWRQKVNVPNGELVACVRLKPFYKDTGTWPPVNVTLKWTNASGQSQQHTKGWHPLPLANQWHDFSGTYGHWGANPVTMEILVDIPATADDPNRPIYIAIDNIALKPKTLVPSIGLMPSSLNQTAIGNGSSYNVVLNWPPLTMPPFAYFWGIEELDNNRNVTRSIINPSEWWWPGSGPNPGSFNFPGFDGDKPLTGPTFVLNLFTWSPMIPAGVFYSDRNYRITYGVWGKCHRWMGRQWELGFFASAKTATVPPVKRLPDLERGLPSTLRGFNMNLFDEKMRPNRFDPSIMRKDRPMPVPNIPGNIKKPGGGKRN